MVEIEFSIVEGADAPPFASVEWSATASQEGDEEPSDRAAITLEVVETRQATIAELGGGGLMPTAVGMYEFSGDRTDLVAGGTYPLRLPDDCAEPGCPLVFYVHSTGDFRWRVVSDGPATETLRTAELPTGRAKLKSERQVADLAGIETAESWRVTVLVEDLDARFVEFQPVLEFETSITDLGAGSSIKSAHELTYRLAEGSTHETSRDDASVGGSLAPWAASERSFFQGRVLQHDHR